MKRLYLLFAGCVFFNVSTLAQYTGGHGDGYSSVSSPAGWASEKISLISSNRDSMIVNGADTSLVVVQLKDAAGTNLTTGGDLIVLSATLGTLGVVIDSGNGTYMAKFTSGATPGIAKITGTVNGSVLADSAVVIIVSNSLLRLSAKVFLQGPYNTGTSLMNTTLNSSGVLAAHFGSTPIPVLAVDSVKIEIRDSVSAVQASLRVYADAWLMADGTLRSFIDTTKAYVELDAPVGSYYIVVRHRNHLAIMSATKLALTTDSTGYDFTTGQAQAYGTNPMAALSGSVYSLISGDANQSGFITATDINDVINHLNGNSYLTSDVNLSAFATATDINIMINNLNKNTQVPN
jgi:hypothetical protein